MAKGKGRGAKPMANAQRQARAAQNAARGRGSTMPVGHHAVPRAQPVSIGMKPGYHAVPKAQPVKIIPKPVKASAGAKAGGAVGNAVKHSKSGKSYLEMMKTKKGIALGVGAAVIGGLAYSGRRGSGSSGGRTSMYKY